MSQWHLQEGYQRAQRIDGNVGEPGVENGHKLRKDKLWRSLSKQGHKKSCTQGLFSKEKYCLEQQNYKPAQACCKAAGKVIWSKFCEWKCSAQVTFCFKKL